MSEDASIHSLEAFLNAFRHNINAPVKALPPFVPVMDAEVQRLCANLNHPKHVNSAKLLMQSQASMRFALALSMAGASSAVHAVLRQAIEAAGHAYLVRFDTDFAAAWRADDPSSNQKQLLRGWKKRLRGRLEKRDPRFWETFSGNYEDWISFGAHPSLISIESLMEYAVDEPGNSGRMTLSVLSGQPERNYGYFSYGNAVLIFFDIFEYVWPDRFQILSGADKRKLVSMYLSQWLKQNPSLF